MTLYYITISYQDGQQIKKIDTVNSEELKRLGREHVCFNDDLFTRFEPGAGHYGIILDGFQLYASRESLIKYWYDRTPRTEDETNAIKKALKAENIA